MYHEYIFYPFFTHFPLTLVKKVDVVESTECFSMAGSNGESAGHHFNNHKKPDSEVEQGGG